jgi:hypothetical protein
VRIAPPAVPPDAPAELEDLIKEARRRQRRRWLAAGVAGVVLLTGGAGVVAGLAGHRHDRASSRSHPGKEAAARRAAGALAPIPRSIDTTVLMWPAGFGQCCGPVAVDNLTTGRLAQSQEPAIGVGDYQPLLTQVGRWLVYVGDSGDTAAIRDDLSGHPRVVGTTPFFAPSAAPGHVWLFRVRKGMHIQIQARLVPVTGGPPGPPIVLPAGTALPVVRGTDAGLLLQVSLGRSFGLALWNPGSPPRSLPYSPAGGISSSDGFDATSRLVAYGTGCSDPCKMLRILNVVTGKLISFAAPPGTAGWVPNGFDLVSAISPGNRMIAAYAAMRPQGRGRARLYLMPITSPSGRPRVVPSSAANLFARIAWSAKGSWLLYQGPGGHLWAYQVTSGKTRASSTPCCQYTVMAAAPSHSG